MEIFKFEKSDVTNHIEHKLRTRSKFREPLKYIIRSLEKMGNSMTITSLSKKINLNKLKEKEGKNYHWSTVTYKGVTLVFRRYGHHLTIFTKVHKKSGYKNEMKTDYGAFTLNANFKNLDDDKQDEMNDQYYDKPFTGLNIIIKDLLKLLLDRGVHWVWNSVSLKRPDHLEIELAFDENSIHSLDSFVFCMEEIDNIYLTIFAETTMLKKLKEYEGRVGEKLNDRYKIGKVITTVKDDYYHSAGMTLIDTKGGQSKDFSDVYSLTRYNFADIFQNKMYPYNGEFYVEGGNMKVGEPVAYKNLNEDDDNSKVLLLQSSFPKENFIALKKM